MTPPPNQGSIVLNAVQIYLKREALLMKVWNQKKKSVANLSDLH